MRLFSHVLLGALALAGSVRAEIPVYRDQKLEVPSAVVLTEGGPVYYGDVRFTANADGSFTLAEAKRRELAIVATVSVSVSQGSATVSVNGEQTIACVGLEEPGVVRKDRTFHVVIAQTPLDPLALCLPFVAVTKFTRDVALDLEGLAPGEYRLVANGVETAFTVDGDGL